MLSPARWTTASSPSSRARGISPAAGFQTSRAGSGTALRPRPTTAAPPASSAGTRAEPMRPEAPVIRTRAGVTARSLLLLVHARHEGSQEIDRDREDGRRVVLGRDLGQGLEVAQLHRRRLLRDHRRGLGQARRRLVLALGVDDLRPPLALGLGLARDRPLHLLRQVHVLDLDRRHLDTPGLGLAVDDLLERLVLLLALRE